MSINQSINHLFAHVYMQRINRLVQCYSVLLHFSFVSRLL